MERDLTLDAKVLSAARIVEGELQQGSCFLGDDGIIRTRWHLYVTGTLKGPHARNLEVLTLGGQMGRWAQAVYPGPALAPGNAGTVFVDAAGEVQQFVAHHNAESDVRLRNDILAIAGQDYIGLDNTIENGTVRTDAVISALMPSELRAGTGDVLSIHGAGFGTVQGTGTVALRNADTGGQTYVTIPQGELYLLWSDDLIQVRVPAASVTSAMVCGTGTVRVMPDGAAAAESADTLRVQYARTEVMQEFGLAPTVLAGPQNGGYLVELNTSSEHLRGLTQMAIDRWACATGINMSIGAANTTAGSWANDGVNLIGMAAQGQLPAQQLARTVVNLMGCGSIDNLTWSLIGFDVLFNPQVEWNYSDGAPAPDQYDLLTTLMHELGHAHLLQHIINPEAVMYHTIGMGQFRRDLIEGQCVAGGIDVVNEALAEGTCSGQAHQPYSGEACATLAVHTGQDEGLSIYPNPVTGTDVTLRGVTLGQPYMIVDSTGRIVFQGTCNSDRPMLPTARLCPGTYVIHIESLAMRIIVL
jgi:hypothetical protein